MKYFFFYLILLAHVSIGQKNSQIVRGILTDSDSKSPLAGATVKLTAKTWNSGTITNSKGEFRFENAPLGRVTLNISYLGYESRTIPNIVVDAGQEAILELELQEFATQLNTLVIKAAPDKGETQNEMSLLSGRSISNEETKRYAGGFNDPAMILSNFAGVTNNGTGSNEVIVRGNSPKYVQWRLEGMEIANPNHFADQNSVGGGISALNNNLLATSDFYTGAFSPEYGDVLSGVYDVKLRNGNNQKFQSILGIGILGTDITLEGPFKKNYDGSFLANYRYSTIGLVSDLGIVKLEGGGPTFQDGAFKVSLPTKKLGSFSLFGLGGLSRITLDNVNPGSLPVPGLEAATARFRTDYKKSTYMGNVGLSHMLQMGSKSYLNTTLSFSGNGIDENVYRSEITKLYGSDGSLIRDSLSAKRGNYDSRLSNTAYRISMTYNHKFNAKNKLQIGSKYAVQGFIYRQNRLDDSLKKWMKLTDFDEHIATLRNFVSWKHRLNNDVTIVAGIHNMNVLYNKKSTIEPRLAIRWNATNRGTLNVGYGLHSKMESVHNYFAKVQQPDGTYTEPNKDLGLLKAHHFVAGYAYRLTDNLIIKTEAYYQHLYNLPVENRDGSYYATINEGLNFRYVNLINRGTGKNYGIEFTIERFFNKNYYFLINTSVFQSKYKSLENRERNTAYADNYLVNLLAGKEFEKLGRKDNQTLSLNAKVFLGGGKKYIPLRRTNEGDLAVDPVQHLFFDYQKAYDNKLDDLYQVTAAVSYKWNKKRSTHELFVNLDNLTNRTSRISEYFDDSKPNSVGYVKQFGIFPNVMYRVYL